MKTSINFLTVLFLTVFLSSCGNKSGSNKNFTLETHLKNNVMTLGDTLNLSVRNKKQLDIDSVTYRLDDATIEVPYPTQDVKLGSHKLTAIIKHDDVIESISTKIVILSNKLPKIYSYKILNEYPHDISAMYEHLEPLGKMPLCYLLVGLKK